MGDVRSGKVGGGRRWMGGGIGGIEEIFKLTRKHIYLFFESCHVDSNSNINVSDAS